MTKKEKALNRIEEQRNRQKISLMDNHNGTLEEFLELCNKVDKDIDRTIEIVLG
jgi:hypothetical protein